MSGLPWGYLLYVPWGGLQDFPAYSVIHHVRRFITDALGEKVLDLEIISPIATLMTSAFCD
jgi:hypothetical protein